MASENIGVYVDGDNANYKNFNNVYDEIKKHGRIISAKIYGDWTRSEMKGWKNISIDYAFETPNCFSLSKKNSTDIYMICDILYDLYNNKNINTFIIVSSDSDYTHVTKRIRAIGKKVIGIGKKTTPCMLKNSCDIFITTEIINNNDNENTNEFINILKAFEGNYKINISKLKRNLSNICNTRNIYSPEEYKYFDKYILAKYPNKFCKIDINKCVLIINISGLKDTIDDIFENYNNLEINLSLIKDKLLLKNASFDQRNYGFKSMKKFIRTLFNQYYTVFELNNSIYIRQK